MNFTLRPSLTALLLFCAVTFSFSQNDKNNALDQQTPKDRIGVVYKANVENALTKQELEKIEEVFGDKTQNIWF